MSDVRATRHWGSDEPGMTRQELRDWLMERYRADRDLLHPTGPGFPLEVARGEGSPACRCCRCEVLLDLNTMSIDRIIPGAHGGKYRKDNIRPACRRCNSIMGAKVRRKRRTRAF